MMKNGQKVRINSTGETGKILMIVKGYNSAYVISNRERYLLNFNEFAAV